MRSVIRRVKQAFTAEAAGTRRSRQGLSRLPPEAIGKAINETDKQVNGIMLAFLGAAAFCVLSLLTPDSALLGGSEKLNVPLAGPVSFVGFMIIGPLVLVLLRAYLEIYIAHGKRLALVARRAPAKRDPTLLSAQNTFLRVAFTLILSLLLPLTLFLFAWKAAVFPDDWGVSLLCVAIAAAVGHLVIPLRRVSWRSKVALCVGAGLVSACVIAIVGAPRRSFNLFRADLANQLLVGRDLKGANLNRANLKGANLHLVHFEHAWLIEAHLEGAVLEFTHFEDAWLNAAHLEGADLSLAAGLTQDQIEQAYGDANTKLPPGLTRPAHWLGPKPGVGAAPA